jgi:tetratricopeptide (TPR) repeat protein
LPEWQRPKISDALVTARVATQIGSSDGEDPKDQLARLAALHAALALLANDRPREALAQLAALGPLGFDLELLRGRAALELGDLELARSTAERSVTLSRRPASLVLRGLVAEAQGAPGRAGDAYRQALALDAEHAAARVGLARLAEAAGRRGEARRGYEAAVAPPFPDLEASWRLAALDIEDGNPDAARARLAELPPTEVRGAAASARIAEAELRAGRPKLARTRVEGALRRHPDSVELRRLADELRPLPSTR